MLPLSLFVTFSIHLFCFLTQESKLKQSPVLAETRRMEVSTSYMLVPVLGLLGYVIYCFYNLLEMYWLKPKRLEKCLRKQGYKGSPYRLRGDPYEKKLIGEALSKPIGLNENIVKRTMPHLINTVQIHGL